ncbi:lysine acyltransferase [Photorhabdus luminescens subsp. luminescens]|uniref:RTX toxin-activating lysine-acyltransferase n=1 Tax=Photorhabdus luminescens TaxID=29488 RepID=A0A1G5R498_PHOLU|nr:RTX toxin-activating lysine-acyltransferase RtxC [Photorhabdus luminescens]KMW72893.1 lysine acyltransferase [Photorhabdus luminescens subsp. luminescens]SCZ68925.1 cytolysin-activating lysine-acyltransferase [Photorhabdus luminescens]
MAIVHQPAKLNNAEIQAMIGGVMLLSQHSPLHRRYLVSEWQQRILPAFELNQFCYYEDEHGRPIAFCNWAFLSEQNRDELLSGERELTHTDWRSGPHIFFPEMIAPFGHGREVARDLRRRVFLPWKGQKACTVRGKLDIQNNRCIRQVQWFFV